MGLRHTQGLKSICNYKRTIPSITPIRFYGTDIEQIKRESDAKDNDTSASATGVVDVEENKEILMYFDHIYANSVSQIRLKQYLNIIKSQGEDIEKLKQQVMGFASPESNPLPVGTEIVDFVALQRDAGAFVKFAVPDGVSPKDLISQICDNVKVHKNKARSNFFTYILSNFYGVYPDVFAVKGVPWIEDLRRFPSTRIMIKFEGPALTEEELYLLLRRYGTIMEILPPTSSSPNAIVDFKRVRSAICAKNCITGMKVKDANTTLHLLYVPIKRVNYITDFISNHQRISVPAILALLATLAVIIFDPIRQFFIEEKIEHRLSLQNYKNNRYFIFFTSPIFAVRNWLCNSYDYIGETLDTKCHSKAISNESDLDNKEFYDAENLMKERDSHIKQLKLWIYENVGTFIIVKGPKGSGKRELVVEDTLLDDENLRKKVLYIDCESIIKSRTDNKLLENLADQIGYYPVFSWVNSISQFVDLGVQSITGQKSGLSETKETQIKNIFLLATQAIKAVAMKDFESYELEMKKKRRRQEVKMRLNPELDIKLDDIMKADEYLQQNPEAKPIIVINKYATKSFASNSGNDFFYKMVSEWAAGLIQSNVAHVIFITNDVGAVQLLNSALPNQVFKTANLNDASEAGSFAYVMNQLRDLRYEKFNPDIIKETLRPLGGRMLDLQSFIRRIRSGESPHESLNELVLQAAEQITTFFLFKSSKTEDPDRNWSPLQVWELIKILSEKDSITYNELISKSAIFKPDENTFTALQALERNDLITLKREKGMLSRITTGRPIYRAAFNSLVKDEEIHKAFEVNHFNNLIKIETAKIATFEDELAKIQFKDYNLNNRLKYLVDKIELSNSKVEDYESRVAVMKSGKSNTRKPILGVF